MSDSLYSRLGGSEGITKIVSDLIDNHAANPLVSARFAGSDLAKIKKMGTDFVCQGTGGPEVYAGKDMLSVHRHMNISDNEFMTVVDDAMKALSSSGIGDREKAEVLYIFYSVRPEVVGV